MEQRHRDALRHNLSYIVDDVDPVLLLVDLPILTAGVKQSIEAQEKQHGKRRAASLLVDEIQRKGPRAFYCFVAALEKNGYPHVVDILLQQLTEVESRHIKANILAPYGPRKHPLSYMPAGPSRQNSQGGPSAAPPGPIRDCGVGKPEYNGKHLNDLPYGYTKTLIKHLNKLNNVDLEKIKDVCELSRREANEVKDGETLFDKLADKRLTHDQLTAVLEDEGLKWIFNRQESVAQSGSAAAAENGHSHFVTNSTSSSSSSVPPGNGTVPPGAPQPNAGQRTSGTTAAQPEPSSRVAPARRDRVLPARPEPSNWVAPPAQQNAGPSPGNDYHEVSKTPQQPRAHDASARKNHAMEAEQLREIIWDEEENMPSNLVDVDKRFDSMKLEDQSTGEAVLHEIREVSLHGSNQPE